MQAARDILSYPDTVRRGQRSSVSIPLSIALLAAGLSGISLSPGSAQTAAPKPADVSPDAISRIAASSISS
jgi:hypothetical protein